MGWLWGIVFYKLVRFEGVMIAVPLLLLLLPHWLLEFFLFCSTGFVFAYKKLSCEVLYVWECTNCLQRITAIRVYIWIEVNRTPRRVYGDWANKMQSTMYIIIGHCGSRKVTFESNNRCVCVCVIFFSSFHPFAVRFFQLSILSVNFYFPVFDSAWRMWATEQQDKIRGREKEKKSENEKEWA